MDWGITKGNLQSGNIRFDININIPHHPIVEIKNLNSFQNIHDAIEYEIKRQESSLLAHSSINREMDSKESSPFLVQKRETRKWDENLKRTILMRIKDEEYFWIREWDIPSQEITRERISRISKELSMTKSSSIQSKELSLETGLDLIKIENLKRANLLSLFKGIFKMIPDSNLVYNW